MIFLGKQYTVGARTAWLNLTRMVCRQPPDIPSVREHVGLMVPKISTALVCNCSIHECCTVNLKLWSGVAMRQTVLACDRRGIYY